MKLPTILL